MVMVADLADVVVGVDTHRDSHTIAVVSRLGAELGQLTVAADAAGCRQALRFAAEHGTVRCWAIEGVNSYGAGLARFLADRQELVVEIDRPQRPARRNGAKSDPIDAVRAAREALTRQRLGSPAPAPNGRCWPDGWPCAAPRSKPPSSRNKNSRRW
jgi:transposase